LARQEPGVTRLVERARRQRQDGLRGIRLAGGKAVTVEFEEQDADHEADALVAVDEGVIAHQARRRPRPGRWRRARRRRRASGVAGLGGLQQAAVAQARRAAVQREQSVVQRECVPLVDPERLAHWASTRSALR
jgi:hypothetical protein